MWPMGLLFFFLDSFITLVYIWQFKRREKQLSYIPTPLDPLMQTTCACIHDVYDGKREENKCPFPWWSATELSGVMMRIRYRIIYIILVCLLCYASSRIFHSNEDVGIAGVSTAKSKACTQNPRHFEQLGGISSLCIITQGLGFCGLFRPYLVPFCDKQGVWGTDSNPDSHQKKYLQCKTQ